MASRRSRSSAFRNWYIWRDGSPEQPPNNWQSAFGTDPAWTYDESTGQWYVHLFLPQQPDLNWAEPAVAAAMHDVLRFWLRRGVDGFRADVVHLIGKEPELADRPVELVGERLVHTYDTPVTHGLLRDIRSVLEEFPGDRAMVGEVNLAPPSSSCRTTGRATSCTWFSTSHRCSVPRSAAGWRSSIKRALEAHRPRDCWPTWVLSNHDMSRHRTRYGGSEARARAAAVLLLTLPGTPFLFAGEELGLEDARISADRQLDPGGRDASRAPIPWTSQAPGHGWPGRPALPFPPEPEVRNVAGLREDRSSILHLYRRLLSIRRSSPAMQVGSWGDLPSPAGVLAYERIAGDDRRVVLVNFSDDAVPVPPKGHFVVGVASDGEGEAGSWSGTLGPSQAVLLTALHPDAQRQGLRRD